MSNTQVSILTSYLFWLFGLAAAVLAAIATIKLIRAAQAGQLALAPVPVPVRGQHTVHMVWAGDPNLPGRPGQYGRDTWGASAQEEMRYPAPEPEDDLPPPSAVVAPDAATDATAEAGLIIQTEQASEGQRPENDVQPHPAPHPALAGLPAGLEGADLYKLQAMRLRCHDTGNAERQVLL